MIHGPGDYRMGKTTIHCYALCYSDYEVHMMRKSYHWTKESAWRAWREYVEQSYAQTMTHPNDVRHLKKTRGHRWYREHFELRIIKDTIEILP